MPHDARVDDAIARAAPFARPILEHLRAAMHAACPKVKEDIKWGRPFFLVAGRPLAFMAAFKGHAAFGFWRGMGADRDAEGAGQFGKLTSLADLPPEEELRDLIRTAAEGTAAPRNQPRPRATRPEAKVPPDLAKALGTHSEAQATFDRLPPGHRRDFAEWIAGAKREETRTRRLEKALAMLAEGKGFDGAAR